jgi:hypothetical protein
MSRCHDGDGDLRHLQMKRISLGRSAADRDLGLRRVGRDETGPELRHPLTSRGRSLAVAPTISPSLS